MMAGWEGLHVPGGLGTLRLRGTQDERIGRQAKTDGWETDLYVLVHDGSALSAVSAAGVWGRRVLLGSPWSAGALVCLLGPPAP